MYIQEKSITEDLAVWARPFAFYSYGEFTKKILDTYSGHSGVATIDRRE
jgi:hypothetical protein